MQVDSRRLSPRCSRSTLIYRPCPAAPRAPLPASGVAPIPPSPPEFPPAHLLLRQPHRCACLKCGPFLETVPCHYLSPSKFQFVVLIPSNCIRSKRVSWLSALSSPCTRRNLPATELGTNYPQTHFSPPGRQPSSGHPGTSPASLCKECPGTQPGGPQARACLFTRNALARPPWVLWVEGSIPRGGGVCEAVAAGEAEPGKNQPLGVV